MKNRKGLTLIEMMIAISLSSLIFLLVSSLMMMVINSNTRSKNREDFEQVKNDLQAEFTNRIRWGEVVQAAGNILTIDGVIYTLDTGKLMKDGEVISPKNVTITSFEVKNLSTDPQLASLELKIGLESATSTVQKDSMRLVVSQRQTSLKK